MTQHPPLQSEEEYDAALAALAKALNTHTDDLPDRDFELLVASITSYENIHYPIDFPDAISAIEFHMDQADLSIKDVAHCFGSIKNAKDVIAGRRELTLSMARSLHENFQIPADVLLGEPDANFDPNTSPDELQHYPWNEIRKREWVNPRVDWKYRFEEMFGELSRSVQNALAPSPALLREAGRFRKKSNPNPYAIRAWCMRVANVASDNPTLGTYSPGCMTHDFMKALVALSLHDDGPLRAQKFLSENGINLVIERHLPKTYLDGAAFRLSKEQPVVGLTLRYDRLDNFWFTLMHELAHIHLHIDNNIGELFVDELDFSSDDLDTLEKDADSYATNSLIPADLWKSSDARFDQFPRDVYHLANSAKIHPAIVVGRIRYENKRYTHLSELVGQGEVRKHFKV